jgi:uncharacterized protein
MKNKILKRIIKTTIFIFILMNIVAFFHAYKFTHFSTTAVSKTKSPDKLSLLDKIKTGLLGVDNPRPQNTKVPTQIYETVTLQSNKKISCWYIKADSAKGNVIIFHGYSGEKSSMIDKSDEFLKLGYNTMLVDFMGSGASEGNQTTIGFKEAEEVKSAYEYLINKGEKNIYLFGTSLGAAAIMKAVSQYNLTPKGLIIECPFGSMYEKTCARFNNMKIPTFPMAGLLVFWGGVQNGFWAFSHKPTNYAKKINTPTLLMYGSKDKNVSRNEINTIFENLKGEKQLKLYANAGHENYLIKYKENWIEDVSSFLSL